MKDYSGMLHSFNYLTNTFFRSWHLHDDLPEGQWQEDIGEVGGFQEERCYLIGLVAGNAAADGGDEELEFLVLPGKGGEALHGRGKVLQAFHGGDGVGLPLQAFADAPDCAELLLGYSGGAAHVGALGIAAKDKDFIFCEHIDL